MAPLKAFQRAVKTVKMLVDGLVILKGSNMVIKMAEKKVHK